MLDQPAAAVARLGPGVGKVSDDALQARLGQAAEQASRVVVENPHVPEIVGLHAREQRGDTVDENLAADEADLGFGGGLVGQVLAGAEADLETDFAGRERKQRRRIERARGVQGDA